MKKILSALLCAALTLVSLAPQKSFAVEIQEQVQTGEVKENALHNSQMNPQVKASAGIFSTVKSAIRRTWKIVFLGLALLAADGCAGYFIGNRQYLKNSKEITFKGTAASSKSEIPTGTIYPIPLARQLLNRIIKEDMPRLKDNQFPAGPIADLETYLWMISGNLGTEPLAQEILTMSQIMSGLISTEDKKVTVGYLVDLLKQSQDLINQAEAQSSTKSDL